jgi:molybdate transport system substrate-binding protein
MRTVLILAALLAVIGLGWLIMPAPHRDPAGAARPSLHVFCAAGLRPVAEAAAAAYTAEQGVDIRLEFGGSGDLETRLGLARLGDLYLPADTGYATRMRERGQVAEILPLARQRPVLAVAKGNPKGIANLADARRHRLGLPNPESASLGKVVQRRMGDGWTDLRAGLAMTKPTVTEVAADLAAGGIDAAIVWDATVAAFPGLMALPLPELGDAAETVPAAVLTSSTQPTLALRFARWLAAPQRGNPIFAKHGYAPLAGDAWAERPEVVLYSGSVNRKAVEPLLTTFAEREGVAISTTFNGCGILCASMEAMAKGGAGSFPDGYYACDICFVAPVANAFPEAVMLTRTEILIAVPKGNPQAIGGLADLARPGLRLGVCNAEQSTLGFMTAKMLAAANLADAVMANARSQVPTGDLLVNQLLTGSLDAAIVYRVNVLPRADRLTTVAITGIPAEAIQPFAVWKDSRHRQVMLRLLDHLRANTRSFTDAGFSWEQDQRWMPSTDLPVPAHLRKAKREF